MRDFRTRVLEKCCCEEREYNVELMLVSYDCQLRLCLKRADPYLCQEACIRAGPLVLDGEKSWKCVVRAPSQDAAAGCRVASQTAPPCSSRPAGWHRTAASGKVRIKAGQFPELVEAYHATCILGNIESDYRPATLERPLAEEW